MAKRKRNPTPEWEFHQALTACSRENDLSGALALYRAAAAAGSSVRLTAHHFNTLLHICSNALGSPASAAPGCGGAVKDGGADEPSPSSVVATVQEAFRIFDHMVGSGIPPSESTITSMARIAAADKVEGGNRAFEVVREMGTRHGVTPRLRTYGPPLFAFCRTAEGAEKAYDVEQHMVSMGVSPEEPELAALLKVSVEAGREEKVYEYLHKLRRSVGCMSPSTAEIVKHWFESESTAVVGREVWDVSQVKNAALLNGGGWHGSGWLGKGKWRVQNSNVGPEGCCSGCGQQLACVDIDRTETEKFAGAVASLAMAREVKTNFSDFQLPAGEAVKNWLNNHAEYDVIVDGANVAYYHQNFADGGFSLSQVEAVIKELLESGRGKQPLVILHNKRIMGLMENDSNRQLLEEWKSQYSLYATPNGSNDDWYWLYASVKLKCLLVTNDEMRDHIFELLGRDFFPMWKERHQVCTS
ncbi:hypothetical protein Taro_008493 [Colocasia esculenta]|uniref:ribonuclease P n=1 Tax=Colocasia esculenta TaxID=4460 RepID=A0A843TYE0_COLES|nr:hypothetical protein [Colocasia esculenta]